MEPIRRRDRLLVTDLAALWAVRFASLIRSSLRAPRFPVSVPAGTSSHPRAEMESAAALGADALAPSGEADVRDVGGLGLSAQPAAALRPGRTVAFQRGRAAVAVDTGARPWTALPDSFAFC